jgi:hypothetical protein
MFGIIILAIALMIVFDLAANRWGDDSRDARFGHI